VLSIIFDPKFELKYFLIPTIAKRNHVMRQLRKPTPTTNTKNNVSIFRNFYYLFKAKQDNIEWDFSRQSF